MNKFILVVLVVMSRLAILSAQDAASTPAGSADVETLREQERRRKMARQAFRQPRPPLRPRVFQQKTHRSLDRQMRLPHRRGRA